MKSKLEILTDPVDPRATLKSWSQSTKTLDSKKDKFRETSNDFLAAKFPRTKSHAQIMRTTMKTFLTDLNIPFPPQRAEKDEEKPEEFEKKRRRSYARVTPEFPFFMNRIDQTVDKLQKLNEKFQKTLLLSNPHIVGAARMKKRRSHVNIFSPTSVPLPSSRPSTMSKNKSPFPNYSAKDFEDPDGNESLIEAIRLIDGNKKSDEVAAAMWVDLGEGYKMYDHLVDERKRKEKEMQNLQEYLKNLTTDNSNQDLDDQIKKLKKEIEQAEQQVVQDEMQCEILQDMLQDRKAHSDLMKQRFNKKYENLPKIEIGLQLGVNEIKKDTIVLETTMKSVGTMYSTLRSLQKLSKGREDDLKRQIKENYQAEKNVALEQNFKDQREEYIKKKKRDEEKELHKQENELYEKITQEIKVCEKQIDEMNENVAYIMQRTKQLNSKEEILILWQELLDKNENLKAKIEEAEAEQNEVEEKLKEQLQILDEMKAKNVTKREVNDVPELCRKEDELEKVQRELEKEQEVYSQNQRLIAGYLAGFSKTFEDIEKKKVELGVEDMEQVPCTEENFERIIEYLGHLVEKIVRTELSRQTTPHNFEKLDQETAS